MTGLTSGHRSDGTVEEVWSSARTEGLLLGSAAGFAPENDIKTLNQACNRQPTPTLACTARRWTPLF